MTDRELVARIARSAGGKAGYKQLVRELGLGGGRERRLLLEQLARLTARGELVKIDREMWGIPKTPSATGTVDRENQRAHLRDNLMAGRLDLHRDGFGFVRPNPRQVSTRQASVNIDEDVFIPPNEINGAMQGDQVLVELDPPKADGRRQGRIVRVMERRNATVVGVFHYSRSHRTISEVSGARGAHRAGDRSSPPSLGHTVVPFDERMTQAIVIPPGAEIPPRIAALSPLRVLGAEALARPKRENPDGRDLEGMIVDVEITSWPTPTRPPIGRVIEVLGDADDFGVDVEMMIRKHQLPRVFPEAVLAEARRVAHFDQDATAGRADFRGLPIVTIDGDTARDFDDAVMVRQRADGGYQLQVHIADVAEYVREGTDLDLEARLRGTSVYFPDRAIPMLPQELSSDICSLRPDEDRLVLSCLIELDAEGRIESYRIAEGVIRSAARLTYNAVHAILEGADTQVQDAEARERIERMRQLAVKMNKRREERGSIDFDLPEPVIEFDEQGQMRGVTRAERTWANRLIEEFMLAANECVATWIEDLGVPSLYRIHEKPEPRRVVQFEELAASFGYSLGLGALPVKRFETRAERRESYGQGRSRRVHEVAEDIAVTPKMYQKLAARIEGKPEERILSYLMLRSLRQARYSEVNEGHFALAAPTYTHFTSPIRRYPDLIVHRIAKTLLKSGVAGAGKVTEHRLASPWVHPSEGSYSPPRPRLASAFAAGMGTNTAIEPPIPEPELKQIADETSQTERRAAEAERELVEWKKVRFMQDRIGEEFAALVLNPSKFGLFVELTDLFVEGLVPIDTLAGDRYTWRENTHEIVGERWGRRFRSGDRVEVILDRILAQERKLQFSIVEDQPAQARKAGKPAKKKGKAKEKKHAGSPAAKAIRRSGKKGRSR